VRAASSSSLPRELSSQLEEIGTPTVPTRRPKKSRKVLPDNGSLRAVRKLHRGSLNLLRVRLPSKNTPGSPSESPTPDPERRRSSGGQQLNLDTSNRSLWEGGLQHSSLATNPPTSITISKEPENDAMGMLIDLTDMADANPPDPLKTSFC